MVTAAAQISAGMSRVELYKLLADPARLRLLALTAEEALSVGELSELMGESQPQVSRKAGALRQAGLIDGRKEGTRTYLTACFDEQDPVLADAVGEGRRLCLEDGSLAKVPAILAAREEAGQRFFEDVFDDESAGDSGLGPLLGHLFALSPLLPSKKLAVDVGTGDGVMLDVLSPLYDRVFAVDRSPARLARSASRIAKRGLSNVSLVHASFDDVSLLQRVDELGGADLVFVGRMLHHVSRPAQAVKQLARLIKPGGHLIVLDYLPHHDEAMREQGDVWLGFSPGELSGWFEDAGFKAVSDGAIPPSLYNHAPDGHLPWQVIAGRR